MRSILRLASTLGLGGLILAGCSPLFYMILESFPDLIHTLGLYRIHHFGTIQAFLPDETLVFRNRPPSYTRILNLRAAYYSAPYGVELPLSTIPYHFDADGFRNGARHEFSDVVLLGDSMVEYGDSEADILAARVEKLSGLSVTSFGVGGYGPFHYLELFKRYGLKKKPKYALFCVYEENDIGDIHEYLKWKKEGRYYGFGILSADFWTRYRAAVTSTRDYLRARIRRAVGAPAPAPFLPDLADLRLPTSRVQMLLIDRVNTDSPEQMLPSEGWTMLRQIITEFRNLARAYHIVPVVVFIPLAANIYAEYSTEASGENWLKAREQQIAAAGNAPKAMSRLARQLEIALIDLTPAFKAKAKAGNILYYPYDQHWNTEGRATAAAVIAQALMREQKSRLALSPRRVSVAVSGPARPSIQAESRRSD
jgi:hypothetical protein